jgi:hypothetical protein
MSSICRMIKSCRRRAFLARDRVPPALLAAVVLALPLLFGCGSVRVATSGSAGVPSSLIAEARPVGVGPRFRPPVRGPLLGSCDRRLGARGAAHVEVFAENRVVIVPAAIGTAPPRRQSDGRIVAARCYGELVTLEPTGVVLMRPGAPWTLGALFRSWGQPLSPSQVASFVAPPGGRAVVFVHGRVWRGDPQGVPLTRHAEIVIEVGPRVPPHATYTFPPGY